MAPKAGRGVGRAAAAKAKAAAAAVLRRKVEHRRERRAALQDLNTLADELGAAAVQVHVKTVAAAEVERTIYVVQARCRTAELLARLRAIVDKWVANGGKLQAELAPAVDLETPSALAKHKVLLPEFELKSKAFTLTYNSRSVQKEM